MMIISSRHCQLWMPTTRVCQLPFTQIKEWDDLTSNDDDDDDDDVMKEKEEVRTCAIESIRHICRSCVGLVGVHSP